MREGTLRKEEAVGYGALPLTCLRSATLRWWDWISVIVPPPLIRPPATQPPVDGVVTTSVSMSTL